MVAREILALMREYAEQPYLPLSETRAPHEAKRPTQAELALEVNLPPATLPRFGDYELLDKLGQGGMGEVFAPASSAPTASSP